MAAPVAGLWSRPDPLLLASTSAVRRRLIEAAGIPVETRSSGIDERAEEAAMGAAGPAEIARRLARAKAAFVARSHPGRLVVGADQVLELDGRAWPKPSNLDDARRQIGRMAGRSHVLHAAVAIWAGGREAETFVETASLAVRPLAPAAIAAYVAAAGEAATRSAGGYEIEGLGIHLFERVAGDTTTILGLPMLPLLAALRRLGALGW